ncbi:single-stranded DNA-binding protein [Sphaerisporangium sp. NPDC088356]|uniref:single-stranded DNA-binding protein n=1 Tax=Sphaerisporangium sp. NPDC088356 TaxID=3154871 RepID=UPI0034420332
MSAETVRRPAMGGTMNDIYITLNGNVAADPRQYHFDDGTRVTSLRLASTRRVFDKASQSWHDGETTFYAVRCYRVLAENVAQSIKIGQPIVVHGKLRIRSYERDGERRFLAEVEATSVGHDLRRGVSRFEKAQRRASTPAFDDVARERLASSTRDWELVGPMSELVGSISEGVGSISGADGPVGGSSGFALAGSAASSSTGDQFPGAGLALAESDESELSLSGSAGDGDSLLSHAEGGGDTAEDPTGAESWPDGETAGRLAA